ncbi:MAG: hypothetical protein ACJ72R_04910 [Nitrososphaeraceae archaeon]
MGLPFLHLILRSTQLYHFTPIVKMIKVDPINNGESSSTLTISIAIKGGILNVLVYVYKIQGSNL